MSDRGRIRFAAVCSVLIHLLVLYPWQWGHHEGMPGAASEPEPVVLNIMPPPQRPNRQLVDTIQPSEEAPAETDLISDANSIAADAELRDGDDPGPRFEEEAALDSVAMAQPAVIPAPVPVPKKPAPPEARNQDDRAEGPPVSETAALVAPPPKADPEPSPAEKPVEPEAVAQVPAPPAPADDTSATSRGRVHDAVKNVGFTNYEAIQDALAPYMKKVRSQVERRWREALLTRYAGTARTEAEIDCAIAPDGRLISASVVGHPKDRVYAALCREAIERAGPFDPFPFSVPDVYRSKNLEIRWTFSFL